MEMRQMGVRLKEERSASSSQSGFISFNVNSWVIYTDVEMKTK
jgi:hypothetical protein